MRSTNFLSIVGMAVLTALAFFAGPLVGILLGAFAGWVVGLFFPGTLSLIGAAITASTVVPAWQVGAILGFVGGFFKK